MKRITILRKSNQGLKYLTLLLLFFTMCLGKAGAQININTKHPMRGGESVSTPSGVYNDFDATNTFGWYDNNHEYKGPAGWKFYIVKRTKGSETGYAFLPSYVGQTGSGEQYANWWSWSFNANRDYDEPIYISGGKNFGIPFYGGKDEELDMLGWDQTDGNIGYQTNGSALPMIESGHYRFELEIGRHVKADESLLFKFYQTGGYAPNSGKVRFREFRARLKNDANSVASDLRATYSEGKEQYKSLLHIEPANANNATDLFTITTSSWNVGDKSIGKGNDDSGASGEGNITGVSHGRDSKLPIFPDGYKFQFDLYTNQTNYTNSGLSTRSDISKHDAAMNVQLIGRPSFVTDCASGYTKITDASAWTATSITVSLNDDSDNKRINLRDALRFDWNLDYDVMDKVSYGTFKVKGQLSADDLSYLGYLAEKGLITAIDLSEATLPTNDASSLAYIPNDFCKNSTTITSVKLPSTDKIEIGPSAFENCEVLETIEYNGAGPVYVGAYAFRNSTKIPATTLQGFINKTDRVIFAGTYAGDTQLASGVTIGQNIAFIEQAAFADTQLKKLYLPAYTTEDPVTPTTSIAYVWPAGTGNVHGATDAARTLYKVPDASLKIQAEDFNENRNAGGFFGNGDESWDKYNDNASYRSDDINPAHIAKDASYDNGYKLGSGRDGYWFNYSFAVSAASAEGNLDYTETDETTPRYFKITARLSKAGTAPDATSGIEGYNPYHVQFAVDGGTKKDVLVNTTTGSFGDFEIGTVALTHGTHVVTYYSSLDIDFDYFTITEVTGATADITAGDNKGVITALSSISSSGGSSAKPSGVGNEFSTDRYKMTGSSETLKIEAEDFNTGKGTGYNFAGTEGGTAGENHYRDEADVQNAIDNKYSGYNGGHAKVANTSNNDWFIYTFYVQKSGTYAVDAQYELGSKEYWGVGTNSSITMNIDGKNSTTSEFTRPSGAGVEDYTLKENALSDVTLDAGWHYLYVKVTGDKPVINLDYFNIRLTKEATSTPTGTDADKVLGSHQYAFENVVPNDCEVVFDGSTTDLAIKRYRNEDASVANAGIKYLLTKTLDEATAYDNVNQFHADAKITRTFTKNTTSQNNWYSVVFPFDVDAATLLKVKTDDNKQVFDRAAILEDTNFKKNGWPAVHFQYLNGKTFLAATDDDTSVSEETPTYGSEGINTTKEDVTLKTDENGNLIPATANDGTSAVIKAGTPFLVRIANVNTSGNVYTFKDIRTYPSTSKPNGNATTGDYAWEPNLTKQVGTAGKDGFDFKGNLYSDGAFRIKAGEWYLAGLWYQGDNDNSAYIIKNYRSYFTASTTGGTAKLQAFLFGNATGINAIGAESQKNGNVYNLNGQLVREGASLEGLPKGLYIVNGKRIVVK